MLHLAALALAIGPAPAPGERVERALAAMGTWLSIEIEAPSRADALVASEAAARAIEAVEARLSTWRDGSELARLLAAPANEPVALSAELAADLALAARHHALTGGAFDPGIGALVRAYGLREGGRTPTSAELAHAIDASGLRHLALDGRTATRLHAGLVIEEGGFGKGVGLDAALDAARAAGATAARIDLGGQILVHGERFSIELADPRARARRVLALELASGSIATSGNSERAIVVGGERAGHILDPRTGQPAPDFGSIAVIAPDAGSADCLSTALYVMGPSDALAWVEAHPGFDAIALVVRDDELHVEASPRARAMLRPLVDDLILPGAPPHDRAPRDPRVPALLPCTSPPR